VGRKDADSGFQITGFRIVRENKTHQQCGIERRVAMKQRQGNSTTMWVEVRANLAE
jgi:hypothetical protein